MLDMIVDRRDLKKTLGRALEFMGAARSVEPVSAGDAPNPDAAR